AKTYGINPPTSATITLQQNVPTTTTTVQGNAGNGGTATQTQGTPGSIIQNPQIRAVDGQKASLKIGERVPVATGSFQPGIGGVGINPLVNTQFQYLDVGV